MTGKKDGQGGCPIGDRVFPVGGGEAVRHDGECRWTLGEFVETDKPPEPGPGRVACKRGDDGCWRPIGTGHSGPARVATEAYRTGWESIFGAKPVVGQA